MSSLTLSDPKARIHALDALRGFALCGIVFINIPQTFQMRSMPTALSLFVEGRFFIIFSLLFGIGFGIFLDRAAQKVPRPRVPLVRRMLVLGAMGALHGLLQPGEVLRFYAAFGLLVLLPCSYLTRRTTVVVGLVLLVMGSLFIGGPALIPGLFVLGMAMSSAGLHRTLPPRPGVLAALTATFTALSVLTAMLPRLVPPLDVTTLDVWLSLWMSFAYMAGFLRLLTTPAGRPLVAVFAPLGRTALTNYLVATVLFVPLGHALRLDGSRAWGTAVALGCGILVVQAVASPWWLRRFRYGPLEWLWRCATWARWMPLRRHAPVPA